MITIEGSWITTLKNEYDKEFNPLSLYAQYGVLKNIEEYVK